MKKRTGLSKLAIGICAIAMVFAVLSAYAMNKMRTTAQDIYDHPYTVSNTARAMRSRLLDMKRFIGILLTTGYEGEEASRDFFLERHLMQNESIEIIQQQYLGPAEDVDSLRNAVDNLFVAHEEALQRAVSGLTNMDMIRFLQKNVYPYYDQVEYSIDTIISFADAKVISLIDSSAATATHVLIFTLILTALLVFLTVNSCLARQKNIQALTDRERELEQALFRAEDASNAKRDFLSRMSHEIRTPLNSVLGGVHLAKVKKSKGQDAEEELALVEQSGQYLLNLINDILDVNRIEAGKIELHREWCSSTETIRTAVKIVQPMMEAKKINFIHPKLDASFGPKNRNFELYIDSQRIKQVMINLLNNAAKFTPEGGTVTFSAKNLYFDDKTATDVITVSDTGCGMSQEFISHIGEAFTQEHNDHSRRTVGSGLGLYIVKNILDVMGGTFSVESEIGKGTTFSATFTYEHRLTTSAEKEQESLERKVDLSGLRVLCAEDNEINQAIMRGLLENEGVKVSIVSDGLQALEAFKQSAPGTFDSILLDMMMPVMSGLEAARELRALDRADAKTTPIIAISADAIQDNIDQAMAFGFTEYLTKPIDPQKLYKTLEKFKKSNADWQ